MDRTSPRDHQGVQPVHGLGSPLKVACTPPASSATGPLAKTRSSRHSPLADSSPSTPIRGGSGWCVGPVDAGTSRLWRNAGKPWKSARSPFGNCPRGSTLKRSEPLSTPRVYAWSASVNPFPWSSRCAGMGRPWPGGLEGTPITWRPGLGSVGPFSWVASSSGSPGPESSPRPPTTWRSRVDGPPASPFDSRTVLLKRSTPDRSIFSIPVKNRLWACG